MLPKRQLIKQDDGKKRKKKKRKSAKRDKVEIKVTPSDEHDDDHIQRRAPSKTENLEVNFSRKRTLSGTSEICVEIDIEAGEESAKTDALVDLNFYDFDENSLSVASCEEEDIEVDVLLDSITEEDGIDAYGLTSAAQEIATTVQMPSADTSVSRLIEEFKSLSKEEVDVCISAVQNKEFVEKSIRAEEVGEVSQQIIIHPQSTEWKHLKDVIFLSCTTKNTIEHASWFKNGMTVDSNEIISIENEGNESRITFEKFNPFYIGVYHVVVDGVGSQPAHISASVPPTIETEIPSTIVHRIGKPLDLQLSYTAYPAPQVKLKHKNGKVILIADIDQYEDSLSIRIKNLKKEDEGDISIFLSNEFGEAETSFTLQLVDTPLAPRNARAVKLTPTAVTLEWDSPENDDDEVLQYVVKRRIAESGRWRKIAKTPNKTYTCEELIPNEFYAFRIVAENEYGEGLPSNVVEVDTPLDDEEDQVKEEIDDRNSVAAVRPERMAESVEKVTETEEDEIVSFTVLSKRVDDVSGAMDQFMESALVLKREHIIVEHPKSQTVTNENEDCIFVCKLSRPAQNVQWFHNDKELWTQQPKMEIITDEKESRLVLHAVDKRDIGDYYVVVDETEKSDLAELSYKVVPTLTYEGPMDAIAAGKHFDFIVKFTGYPSPQFDMTLNGKDLKLLADVEIYDDFISFRVRNVKESGTITISARNEHGEDSLEISMQVIDVPSAPLDLQASDVGSSTATLSWKAPLFSNGSNIAEYCVERKSVEYSRWRTVARVPADKLTVTVTDLFPNDLYAFRVSAVNDVGQGHPSKVAEVETTEEIEEMYEEEITERVEFTERDGLPEEVREEETSVPSVSDKTTVETQIEEVVAVKIDETKVKPTEKLELEEEQKALSEQKEILEEEGEEKKETKEKGKKKKGAKAKPSQEEMLPKEEGEKRQEKGVTEEGERPKEIKEAEEVSLLVTEEKRKEESSDQKSLAKDEPAQGEAKKAKPKKKNEEKRGLLEEGDVPGEEKRPMQGADETPKEQQNELQEVGSEKKKKRIPKAIIIPDEISSKFGEPSTLHSETNITTKITAREGSAETMSPIKQPQSASITMKVDSASKIQSRTATPSGEATEFTFKQRSQTPEGKKEDTAATVKLKNEGVDRTGLPPKPGGEAASPKPKEETKKKKKEEKSEEKPKREDMVESVALEEQPETRGKPERKSRKQVVQGTIPEGEAVDALSGDSSPRESEAVSIKTSRKSSGASSVDSYTISRRRMRKGGFLSTPGAEVVVLRGDSVKFECELVNESEEVEWFINDKSFAADARASEESKGPLRILVIQDLSPADTGMTVEVRLGDNVATSKVIVEDTLAEITKRLERRSTGKEGENVVLSIELNHEAKEIAWFKDEKPISNTEKVTTESEGTYCRLTIKRADYSDAGQYTVVADGSKSYTNLQILGKPKIKRDEKEIIEVERDENIVFNIPFECHEEPNVSCLFNGSVLCEDAKTLIDVHENVVRFCKKHVTKVDSGEYTIRLFNENGEESVSVPVLVKDVPEKPSSISVTEIETEAITIAWNAPNDDGGQLITGYLIEKKEDGRRTFHKVAQVSGASRSYTVDELEMQTGYILRVSAVNKYGAGEPIETPVVTTGSPYKAPTITDAPVVSEITENTCVLTWEKPTEDGGSPIYGYDVYKKEDNGGWIKMNDEFLFQERFKVLDLLPNINYVFKIEAHNEAGFCSASNVESEPLLISPILGSGRPTSILPIPRITITGEDSVTVEWDVDDDEPSTEFIVSYKSESSSVQCHNNSCTIEGLKEGVSYVFKVAPRNEVGVGNFSEESQPIKVIPSVAPVIIKPIRNTTIPKKRSLHLECHANAEPAPEYIWYKDGKEIIPQNANTEIVNEGYMSFLIIHSVESCDAGVYKCEVENQFGKTSCSATVSVTDVRCHFESSFSEYTEVIEGQEIKLECTLSDEDGVVEWYKDGKILAADDRISILSDDKIRMLRITSVKEGDSGIYRCQTSDGRSRTEGELLIKEEEPHISVGPQDNIIKEFGIPVELRCELTKPANRVLWFKNGKEIWPQTNKYAIVMEDCVSTLKILNFDKSDIGEYYAALNEKDASAPAHLNLEVAPEIKILENIGENVVVHAHTEFDFHVEADGHPQPTVNILHNNSRVQSGPKVEVEEYENTFSVRMRDVTRDEIGTISITAENCAGVAHKEFHLDVIDVPSEPLELKATNTTQQSTTLSWKVPTETNGAPITGFIIERKAVDSSRWRTIGKTNARTLKFEAVDLLTMQVYGFRVIAVNEAGEGPPCHPVDVLISEEETESDGTSSVSLNKPDAPTAELEGKKAVISWNPIEDAILYRLEQKHDFGEWEEVATIHETSFVNSLEKDGSYTYRVIATNSFSESNPSEESIPISLVSETKGIDKDELDDQQKQVIDGMLDDKEETVADGLPGLKASEASDKAGDEAVKDGEPPRGVEEMRKEEEKIMDGEVPEDQKASKKEQKTPKKKGKVQKKEKPAQTADEGSKVDDVSEGQKVKDASETADHQEKIEEAAPKVKKEEKDDKALEKQEKSKLDGTAPEKIDKEEDGVAEKLDVTKKDQSDEQQKEDKGAVGPKKDKADKDKKKGKDAEKLDVTKKVEADRKKEEDEAAEKLDGIQADDKVPEDKKEVKKKEVSPEKADEKKKEATKKKKEKKVPEAKVKDVVENGEQPSDSDSVTASQASEIQQEKLIQEPKKSDLILKPNKEIVEVKTGRSFELTVDANNDVKFEWTRDGHSLDSTYSIKDTKTRSTVHVKSASSENAGKYECKGTAADGDTAIVWITVKIPAAPIIELESKVVEVKVGETATLFANILGATDIKCVWKKDGKPIKVKDCNSRPML
ncbi:hypothetical protein NECAME_13905 [Necator americanus]|uniref:Fibronectin type III domain protein n=1 Tax=Necator americanus TaxID=51031 RepID=W2SS28_NECAM|nr:hypothetical protein NECAME_13905 [Necator americanus]ETN72288.1 hypothetical protein NECAME_13905 [Necator americanus]